MIRTRDLEKKNLVRVSLKDKGKQALELSSDTKVIPRILSSLSEEQRQQLITCLDIVRAKALEELGIKKGTAVSRTNVHWLTVRC